MGSSTLFAPGQPRLLFACRTPIGIQGDYMNMGKYLFRDKSKRANSRRSERGASLVEFAFIAPFLILLLLGVIEFGYLFGEFNDVRHGAREGARVAAVNAGDNGFLHTTTCDAMDLTTNITVQFTDGASGAIGDVGTVTVQATPDSLSGLGLIELFLPNTLTSTVEFRLEQPSGLWWTDAGAASC